MVCYFIACLFYFKYSICKYQILSSRTNSQLLVKFPFTKCYPTLIAVPVLSSPPELFKTHSVKFSVLRLKYDPLACVAREYHDKQSQTYSPASGAFLVAACFGNTRCKFGIRAANEDEREKYDAKRNDLVLETHFAHGNLNKHSLLLLTKPGKAKYCN